VGAFSPGRARVRFGNLWVDALSFPEALAEIERLVDGGLGASVFTPNVDHVVTAEDDEAFREAYAAASLSLADGQPLIWASRLLGAPLPAKISGSDLVLPLMELAARRRWRVYLLGGGSGVAAAAATRSRSIAIPRTMALPSAYAMRARTWSSSRSGLPSRSSGSTASGNGSAPRWRSQSARRWISSQVASAALPRGCPDAAWSGFSASRRSRAVSLAVTS